MIHLIFIRKSRHWYVAFGRAVLAGPYGNDVEAVDWAEDMGWAELGWEATRELDEQPGRPLTRS